MAENVCKFLLSLLATPRTLSSCKGTRQKEKKNKRQKCKRRKFRLKVRENCCITKLYKRRRNLRRYIWRKVYANHTPMSYYARHNFFSLLLIFALRCIKRHFHLADLVSHKKVKKHTPIKPFTGCLHPGRRAFVKIGKLSW